MRARSRRKFNSSALPCEVEMNITWGIVLVVEEEVVDTKWPLSANSYSFCTLGDLLLVVLQLLSFCGNNKGERKFLATKIHLFHIILLVKGSLRSSILLVIKHCKRTLCELKFCKL